MSILNSLTRTIEAKTTAAMAELDHLEGQIALAIERAEQAARERIQARLAEITQGIEDRLGGFEIRLGEMLGEALGSVDVALAQRLGTMTSPTAPEQPQETEEPQETALPSWEALEGANPEELAEEVTFTPDPIPTDLVADHSLPTVHAHAVADDGLAFVDDPDAAPTTSNPQGLHTRETTGTGRAKYHPAENPEHGEVYFLRDHRRHWNPVRFVN